MSSSNAAVYGGDEINAIVLDPGSYHTRIGYAGDDFPKIVTPSYFGTYESDELKNTTQSATTNGKTSSSAAETTSADASGKTGDVSKNGEAVLDQTTDVRIRTGKSKLIFGEDINVPRSNFYIKPIMKDSVITDWDAAIQQYEYYFDKVLQIDYLEQPILITEPIWSEPKYRQNLIENFYENFKFPALYLAKTPTCISFQQGRPNCLVVDIGHDTISITPVVDGISLLKHSVRTHYGGQFLNDQIQDFLVSKSINLDASYKIKSKTATIYPQTPIYATKSFDNITQSFDDYQRQKIWHEFKETVLEVPERSLVASNMQQQTQLKEFYNQDSHKRLFEFPSGQSIEIGMERFQLAETIFDPDLAKFQDSTLQDRYPHENGELKLNNNYEEYRPIKRVRKNESIQSTPPLNDSTSKSSNKASDIRGLAQLITYTLLTIDIDLRASVAHNIIVTGGSSLLSQLTERLYNELSNSNPGLKIRLHAAGNSTERVNQAWIGGSVLASLGTFHQMWVSKEEYREAGVDRILNQRFR